MNQVYFEGLNDHWMGQNTQPFHKVGVLVKVRTLKRALLPLNNVRICLKNGVSIGADDGFWHRF